VVASDSVPQIYEAIGRFVVAFSQLQYRIESLLALFFGHDHRSARRASVLIAGERGPEAMATWAALRRCMLMEVEDRGGDATEAALLKALNKEISGLIQARNDVAHGVWSLRAEEGGEPALPEVFRPLADGQVRRLDLTPERLERLTAQMDDAGDALLDCGVHFVFADNNLWPPSRWYFVNEEGRARYRPDAPPGSPHRRPGRPPPA
jgi:hypothetical protein